jgi:hypothetical protein
MRSGRLQAALSGKSCAGLIGDDVTNGAHDAPTTDDECTFMNRDMRL